MMQSSLLDLVRRQDVQKELELTDDQLQEVAKLEAKQRGQMRGFGFGFGNRPPDRSQGAGGLRPGETPNRDQRREPGGMGPVPDFAKMFAQANQEIRDGLAQTLLPHQMTRLEQLAAQMRMRGGTMAMLSPDLIKELGISEQQQEQLRAKAMEVEKEVQQKIAEVRRQAQQQVISTMTADQQAKLRTMLGEPFEFQSTPPPQWPLGGPREPAKKE